MPIDHDNIKTITILFLPTTLPVCTLTHLAILLQTLHCAVSCQTLDAPTESPTCLNKIILYLLNSVPTIS